jgi:predicted nucleic acid-binding Zn ribbon protein
MQSIGSVLDRVLADLGLKPALQGWRAVEAWPTVVGPRLAARTRAVAFRDGTLHVEVDGSAWLHEIGFLKRDLLRRLHDVLGANEVKDLRFMTARGRTPR